MMSRDFYSVLFKPLVDSILALVILLIASPVLIMITLVLLWTNRGKPFFTQKRPGKNGRIFYLVKFCTMRNTYDAEGRLLPDNERMTKVGKILRSYSLDELPQLINVIKGDLSLVGPRPLLIKYLPLYNNQQARRHEVRPGITGWAQVNGRNAISWKQKFEYDVWYVDNVSFLLDLKILWMTFLKVIKREGINANENITMEPFNGNN